MNDQQGAEMAALHEICGAIHIHTTYSDGSASFPQLILTAQEVGLDFVTVTDHMSLGGRQYQGFHNGLLVIVGYEHNDSANINHYLALETPRVFTEHSAAVDYVHAVHSCGGTGFVAHPFEKRNYFENLPPFPWTAWESDEFDGLEIWNQISDWVEKLKTFFSFFRFLYPRRFLAGVYPETLRKWDTLNQVRFVAGIGGVDAHTRKISLGFFNLEIFPLKVELKGVRTHLYLEKPFEKKDPEGSRKAAVEAMRKGHGFVSNYRWGDARGSEFRLEDGKGCVVCPGLHGLNPALPARLAVKLPMAGDIRLVLNGEQVASGWGNTHCFDLEKPGIYRVEVIRKGHAWIYSNPFPIR